MNATSSIADLDQDGDGIPDGYELSNSMDSFSAADASQDTYADGEMALSDQCSKTAALFSLNASLSNLAARVFLSTN